MTDRSKLAAVVVNVDDSEGATSPNARNSSRVGFLSSKLHRTRSCLAVVQMRSLLPPTWPSARPLEPYVKEMMIFLPRFAPAPLRDLDSSSLSKSVGNSSGSGVGKNSSSEAPTPACAARTRRRSKGSYASSRASPPAAFTLSWASCTRRNSAAHAAPCPAMLGDAWWLSAVVLNSNCADVHTVASPRKRFNAFESLPMSLKRMDSEPPAIAARTSAFVSSSFTSSLPSASATAAAMALPSEALAGWRARSCSLIAALASVRSGPVTRKKSFLSAASVKS
mmetsp:Transcript_17936/g.63351  ORF Transcript_17936/g.63351 Transcript_17936/m.63351 type:complete len:280 (-) Transcript_17936:374-1213(-)